MWFISMLPSTLYKNVNGYFSYRNSWKFTQIELPSRTSIELATSDDDECCIRNLPEIEFSMATRNVYNIEELWHSKAMLVVQLIVKAFLAPHTFHISNLL